MTRIFNDDELAMIVALAIDAGLFAPDVEALLHAGLPPSLVASFPTSPSPKTRVGLILRMLNETPVLRDGETRPLSIWLANAERHLDPRKEAEHFAVWRRKCDARCVAMAGAGALERSFGVSPGGRQMAERTNASRHHLSWLTRLMDFLVLLHRDSDRLAGRLSMGSASGPTSNSRLRA